MTYEGHEVFIQRCIQLAKLGLGHVAPNPMVGAVLVHHGKIIGEGYHQRYGESHAEVNAIQNADGNILQESTLYVNLEPCSHFGKTPPCADLIIEKKIPKVVIGCKDPYKEVAGRGIKKLETAGIEVILNVCENESMELNKRFFTAVLKNRPYIILKYAQTTDGYLGRDLEDAESSKQISNEFSRRLTHKWRSEESGILVGTNTALLDNPMLNTRLVNGRNPVRIAFDKDNKIPSSYLLLDGSQKTIVFNQKKIQPDSESTRFIAADFHSPGFLEEILKILLNQNIQSILVEGGANTLQKLYDSGLWDEARIFTSPVSWGRGVEVPVMSNSTMIEEKQIHTDTLTIFKNNKALWS